MYFKQADEPPGREAAMEAEVADLRAQLAAFQRQSAKEADSFLTPPSKLTRASSQHSLAAQASPELAGSSSALVSAVEKVAGNSQKTLHSFFASPGSSPGGASLSKWREKKEGWAFSTFPAES